MTIKLKGLSDTDLFDSMYELFDCCLFLYTFVFRNTKRTCCVFIVHTF